MILIEKTQIMGLEPTIRGMRNPMNSWAKSDSGICKGGDSGIGCENCAASNIRWSKELCGHYYDGSFQIGINDMDLMLRLAKAGSVDGKFRRMIAVYVDITAPLYWWKEFDTYKVGTVANSCSTMHKIHGKMFEYSDFSYEHLVETVEDQTVLEIHNERLLAPIDVLDLTIAALNRYRMLFLETKDKRYWWQMIQLLPSSYNQKRTVMLNYEVLANIYQHWRNHKLDEWRTLCQWIEDLPYSEIITCNVGKEKEEVDNLKTALAKLRSEKWSEEQITKALHEWLDAQKED